MKRVFMRINSFDIARRDCRRNCKERSIGSNQRSVLLYSLSSSIRISPVLVIWEWIDWLKYEFFSLEIWYIDKIHQWIRVDYVYVFSIYVYFKKFTKWNNQSVRPRNNLLSIWQNSSKLSNRIQLQLLSLYSICMRSKQTEWF